MTITDTTRPAGTMAAGEWQDGYQAVAQAPVSFTSGDRSRYIGGHHVKGAWSDPWWMIRHDGGAWAISKRWKSKAQDVFTYADGRYQVVPVAAIDERITDPWEGASS